MPRGGTTCGGIACGRELYEVFYRLKKRDGKPSRFGFVILDYSASSASSTGASSARMDREIRLCSRSMSMIFASTS